MPKTAPDNILELTVTELEGHWLEMICAGKCTRVVHYPFRLMAMEIGGGHTLRHVVEKARCKQCGQEPARLVVVENIVSIDALGNRGGWEIRVK
jgi:hypothetical protein